MSKLSLSFGCWDYDRIRPIVDGSVKVEGIELNWLNMPVEETFFRMMRHQEFDVAELSLSSYLIAKDRGFPNFTAIPVFISRMFRHSGIYINTNSGIFEPKDLIGKKIGIPEYQLTACVWIRGILNHYYGVKQSDVQWFIGGEETPGRVEKVKVDLPSEISIQPIGEKETLNELLESGEIDAFIGPRAPSSFLKGSPNVKRLFPIILQLRNNFTEKQGYSQLCMSLPLKMKYWKNILGSLKIYIRLLRSKEHCL